VQWSACYAKPGSDGFLVSIADLKGDGETIAALIERQAVNLSEQMTGKT